MHEQDIRRAIGRPGGYDSPVAAHVLRTFGRALPMVVGKRVAPPAGTIVRLDVPDAGLALDACGSATTAAPPPWTTTPRPPRPVTLSPEDFVVLGGRPPRTGGDRPADRGRRGARPPRCSSRWRSRREPRTASWTPPTSPTRPASARWSPASRAASASTPCSSSPATAPRSSSARATRPSSRPPSPAIQQEVPGAKLHPLTIDVSDLASVRRAAEQVTGRSTCWSTTPG